MLDLAGPAPAKVNLTLDILGRRRDGYHELRSLMQTLELADAVCLVFDTKERGVSVAGPFAAGVPADAENLAWRAARVLAQLTAQSVDRLHIDIEKNIPVAGGLGGGAADAAATLRLLQRVWGASDKAVREAAVAVGSDETYLLSGGTALVEGRGERVTPLPPLPRHGVVLFVPRATIERKTTSLFTAVSGTPFDSGDATEALLRSARDRLRTGDLTNGFERVAFGMFPGLDGLRRHVERAIDAPVRLCGAGPTLFWLGPEDEAEGVATATRHLDCHVIQTATSEGSWAR